VVPDTLPVAITNDDDEISDQASRLYLERRSPWSIRKGKIKKRAMFIAHKLALSYNGYCASCNVDSRFLHIITVARKRNVERVIDGKKECE